MSVPLRTDWLTAVVEMPNRRITVAMGVLGVAFGPGSDQAEKMGTDMILCDCYE
jgi:hypothetical protein